MSTISGKQADRSEARTQLSPSQALILAAWFGMLTGIGEVILLGIKKFGMHQFILLGPQTIWMSPLADIAIFIGLVAPLAVINWRKPGSISLRIALVLLSFLAFLSFALMYAPLARWAAVVLSLGLAVQSAQIVAKFERIFMQLVNLSFPWMMIGLGLAAFGMVLFKP